MTNSATHSSVWISIGNLLPNRPQTSDNAYNAIKTYITLTSQWARWRLKSPASGLFTQLFIQVQIKENIKAPHHWPLCGEFTGDVNSPHKRPVTRKMFPFDDVIMNFHLHALYSNCSMCYRDVHSVILTNSTYRGGQWRSGQTEAYTRILLSISTAPKWSFTFHQHTPNIESYLTHDFLKLYSW